MGPNGAARSALEIGRPEEALKRLEMRCRSYPGDGDAQFLRAQALAELGRWDDSLRAMERAQRHPTRQKEDFRVLRETVINGAWNEARDRWRDGDRRGATAQWDWLCREEPDTPAFLAWSGHGHLALADTTRALERYTAAAVRGETQAAIASAAILAHRHDWNALAQTTAVALARSPDSAILLRARAAALDQLARREEAVVAYEAAIAHEGYVSDLVLPLAFLLLELEDAVGAIEVLRPALEESGDQTELLLCLGQCEFELDRYTDARASFERVLEFDVKNNTARDYLHLLEIRLGSR
jgi:tetratricopeptide (TPR) repeat protein